MTLYGLTCGYWTDDPEDLDNHVIRHASDGSAEEIFDLVEEQAPTDPILRDCGDGLE